MFNYRLMAIIKRELREKLLSKSFILMTILLPVFMFGIIGIQAFIVSFEGEEAYNIQIISESPTLTETFEHEFTADEYDTLNSYSFQTLSEESFKEYLKNNNEELVSEKITGVFFVPNSAFEDKHITYYAKTPKNFKLIDRIENKMNRVLVEQYFVSKNIAPEEMDYALKSVDISRYKVELDQEAKEEGVGNMILSFVFSFLLYISLLMMGSFAMQAVIQEKTNRIIEVLLSSVTSKELLAGKIIGSAVTGFFQMIIWMIPIILVVTTSWFALPGEITFDITLFHFGYLLFNYLVGLITFIGLFAMVGSIFDNPQDAQSGMWPIMLLIMIPFFIAMSMMSNPTTPIGYVASMIPFASIIVMPARMALVDVPIWQQILAVVINIGTLLAIFPIAGKIFRVGIMVSGKKPKWSQVIGWLKYKY